MASKNKVETTIKYQGIADFSNIISQLKSLRSQVENTASSTDLLGIDKEFKKLTELQSKLQVALSKGFSTPQEFKEFEKLGKELYKTADGLNAKFQSIHMEGLAKELEQAKQALKESKTQLDQFVKTQQQQIANELKGVQNGKQYAQTLVNAAKEGKSLKEVQAEITDELDEQIRKQKELQAAAQTKVAAAEQNRDNIRNKAASMTAGGKVSATSFITANGGAIDKTSTLYSNIKKAYEDAFQGSTKASTALVKFKEELGRLNVAIKNEETLLNAFGRSFQIIKDEAGPAADAVNEAKRELTSANKGVAKAEEAKIAVTAVMNTDQVTEGFEEIGRKVENYKNKTEEVGTATQRTFSGEVVPEVKKAGEAIEESRQGFEDFGQTTKENFEQQEALNQSFDRMKNVVKDVLSITTAWKALRKVITETYNDVQHLDKAFAEIAMVTKYSVNDMWGSYDQYVKMAKELGQTTQSVIKASGLFYQQGLETNEALQLTESTMKLATLAGLDFKEATSEMTAALRGFHMEMDQGEHITDVYSQLAAHAAADVEGIAYAISKTASIANSAGMSFENTSAFLTQMIETTQEAPENLGTAMKTIIARFTELKENVAGTADSEFDDLDYNKVDKALKTVGVSIKDATGQFRNLDEVFLELSEKWNTLDRNSQRYIATIAAGSRQQSRFIAMMENYERTMELVQVAQDSAGKSNEQFAKYQDTVEYKINQLKTSWESLRISFIDSDFFKGAIESLTKFVDKIGTLDAKQLASIGVIGITAGKTIITNFISSIKNSTNEVTAAWKQMTSQVAKANSFSFEGLISKAQQKQNVQALEEVKTKLKEIGIVTDENNSDVEQQIIKYLQLNQTIEEQKSKYDLIWSKIEQIEGNTNARTAAEEEILQQLWKQADELDNNIQKYEKRKNAIANTLNLEEKLTNEIKKNSSLNKSAQKYNFNPSQLSENQKQWISGIKNSVSSSLTTALIMGIGGADFKTTAKTAGVTFVTSMAPMLIQKLGQSVLPKLGSMLTSVFTTFPMAGLVAAGVAAAAAIVTILYKQFKKISKDLEQTLTNAVENAQKRVEELQKKTTDISNEARDEKNTLDNMKKMQEEYNELSTKIIKTTEEQERYNELVNEIREKYPQIVTYYNEATNELQVQNDLWASLIAKQEKATKKSAGYAAGLNYAEAQADYDLFVAQSKLDNYNLDKSFVSNIAFENLSYADLAAWQLDNIKHYEIDARDALKTMEREGFNVSKVSKDLGYELNISTDAGAKEFLEVLASTSDNTELLQELNIENIEQYQDLINNYNQTLQSQKDVNDDYIEQQRKILEDRKKAALAEYVQQTTGYSSFVSQLISSATLENNNTQMYNSPLIFTTVSGIIFKELNTEAQEWETFNDDQKEIMRRLLEASGETVSNWEEIRKDSSKYEPILENYDAFAEEYLKEKFADEIANTLTPDKNALIDEWAGNLSNYNLADLEKTGNELINKLNLSEDSLIKQALEKNIQDTAQQMQDVIDNIQQVVGNKIELSGLTNAQLQAYDKLIQDYIKEVGSYDTSKFFNSINNLFANENLDNNTQIKLINSIDWTDASIENWDTFSKQAKNTIEELTDWSSDKVDSFFEELAEKAENANLVDLTISNANELGQYIDRVNTASETMLQYQDQFIDIISTQNINGEITLDQYNELKNTLEELGYKAKDYVDITSDGKIIAKAQKLKDLYEDQALSIVESLKEERQNTIKNLQLKYEQLELEYSILYAQYMQQTQGQGTRSEFEAQNQELTQQLNLIKEEIANEEKLLLLFDEEINKIQGIEAARKKVYQEKLWQAYADGAEDVKEYQDAVSNAKTAVTDAAEKVKDAYEDIQKAQQDVIDKQKELNESLYGTEYHKNQLDGLYNYTTNLERLQKAADKAKDTLGELSENDNLDDVVNAYLANIHGESVNLQAQNQVLEKSIGNYKNSLDKRLGQEISKLNSKYGANMSINMADFYYKTGDRWNINFQALNAANIPDEVSDYVEKTVEEMNKLQDSIDDNVQAIKKREQEIKKIRQDAVKAQISLETEVANVLKEKYEKEISDLEDKYDAMKEADDDYINALEKAIEKQRKLRDREDQWEELAQKQKQLSLMQRDTSGSNKIETKKLAKDIKKDQRSLLDNAVDDIIDNLKELYELQAESREAEIEFQENLLENSNLIAEANQIIANWGSAEDAVAWFYNNVADLSEMSAAQLEQQTENWKQLYEDHTVYLATCQKDFEDALIVTSEEIQETVYETSEVITAEAERALGELTNSVDKAIQSATDSLKDALKSLADAQKSYNEALKTQKIRNEELLTAEKALADARAEAARLQLTASWLLENKDNLGTISMKDFYVQSGVNSSTSNDELVETFKKLGIHGFFGDGMITFATNDIKSQVQTGLAMGKTVIDNFFGRASKYKFFKSGGMVDYTGPAWVDGTPTKPEAFLNAEDTERIGAAAKLLADLPLFTKQNLDNMSTSSVVGDTIIEVNVTVENVSSDYDVDQAVERVKQGIVEAANYAGSNVIIRK